MRYSFIMSLYPFDVLRCSRQVDGLSWTTKSLVCIGGDHQALTSALHLVWRPKRWASLSVIIDDRWPSNVSGTLIKWGWHRKGAHRQQVSRRKLSLSWWPVNLTWHRSCMQASVSVRVAVPWIVNSAGFRPAAYLRYFGSRACFNKWPS